MVGGINANRLSLDTVGHNISNASTTGYSRQSVNLAATRSQEISSIYGYAQVGTGVDSLSITRARNIYADKQYWKENADQGYYDTLQTNYDKVETIFNDSSDNGIQSAMEAFYQAWSDLSTNASDSSTRITTVEQGEVFADRVVIKLSAAERALAMRRREIVLSRERITSALISEDPWAWLRGVRSPGAHLPTKLAIGTWRGFGGNDFCLILGYTFYIISRSTSCFYSCFHRFCTCVHWQSHFHLHELLVYIVH